MSKKNKNKEHESELGNFMLMGMGRPIFDAFCALGSPPKIWVKTGRQLGTQKISDTLVYDYSPLKFTQVDALYTDKLDFKIAYKVRERALPIYLRNINRIERNPRERSRTWVSHHNNFEMMLHWYFALLKKHNIETIVFDNAPHGGSNVILYYLAKYLGIQIVVPYQTLFGENFFLMSDYTDLGEFKTSLKGKKKQVISVNPEPVPPFYSRKLPTKLNILWQLTDAYLDYYYKMFSARTLDRNILRPKKRRISILKEKYQFLNKIKQSLPVVDMNVDFIYYPLHFQPEMNVDVFGEQYSDQLLAVEELRHSLPDHIHIYVKENPHQTAYAREDSFYKRLKRLPNVSYLSPRINTYDLIKNCKAVATITGTAGWEALQMGKPVICYGYAWYRSLPGIFRWSDKFDWRKIDNFKFNQSKLEKALVDMSYYFNKGVSNPKGYSDIVPGFDEKENGMLVARSICHYISEKKKKA